MNSMKLCFLMMKLQSLLNIANIFAYCQSYANIALNKNARQSVTYFTYYASLAVDGNLQTRSAATPDSNGYSWWQVDLENNYTINNVVISNSDVYPDSEDINDIFVTLSVEKNDAVDKWSENKNCVPKNGKLMMCKLVQSTSSFGRYVTIWRNKPSYTGARNVLTLAEVFIYGDQLPIPTISSTTESSVLVSTTNNILQLKSEIRELKGEIDELRMEKENMLKLAIGISVGVGLFLIIIAIITGIIIGKKCASQRPGPSIQNNGYETAKKGDEVHKYSDLEKKNESNEQNEPAYIDII